MIWLRHDFYKIVVVPHCRDGQQNEDETDVDCGGSCKPCQGVNSDNSYYLFFCKWYIFTFAKLYIKGNQLFICSSNGRIQTPRNGIQ